MYGGYIHACIACRSNPPATNRTMRRGLFCVLRDKSINRGLVGGLLQVGIAGGMYVYISEGGGIALSMLVCMEGSLYVVPDAVHSIY